MRWLSRGCLFFNARRVGMDSRKPFSAKAQSLKMPLCHKYESIFCCFALSLVHARQREKRESRNHYFRCVVFDKGACCIPSYVQPFHPFLFDYAATTVLSTKAIRGQKQEWVCMQHKQLLQQQQQLEGGGVERACCPIWTEYWCINNTGSYSTHISLHII